jgi:hypothetical protein
MTVQRRDFEDEMGEVLSDTTAHCSHSRAQLRVGRSTVYAEPLRLHAAWSEFVSRRAPTDGYPLQHVLPFNVRHIYALRTTP